MARVIFSTPICICLSRSYIAFFREFLTFISHSIAISNQWQGSSPKESCGPNTIFLVCYLIYYSCYNMYCIVFRPPSVRLSLRLVCPSVPACITKERNGVNSINSVGIFHVYTWPIPVTSKGQMLRSGGVTKLRHKMLHNSQNVDQSVYLLDILPTNQTLHSIRSHEVMQH